jgi:hypothetical protein
MIIAPPQANKKVRNPNGTAQIFLLDFNVFLKNSDYTIFIDRLGAPLTPAVNA